MVNKEFYALCSKAWTLQVLAYLGQGKSARISPIAHELNSGRTAISASIQHLIKLGYLNRATGHGHPLRPEYKLTTKGQAVASWAVTLDNILDGESWQVARRTWALPVQRIAQPSRRFGEFRAELAPVTDRALSQTLKTLCQSGWLTRKVDGECMPPAVSYFPDGFGEKLTPFLHDSFRL